VGTPYNFVDRETGTFKIVSAGRASTSSMRIWVLLQTKSVPRLRASHRQLGQHRFHRWSELHENLDHPKEAQSFSICREPADEAASAVLIDGSQFVLNFAREIKITPAE
jgi:hypothetical protein